MKAKKVFLFISIIIFLGVGAYFGQQHYGRFQKAKQEQLLYEARKTAWQALQQSIKSEIGQFKGEAGIVITNLVGIDYLNNTFKSFGLKNTDLSRKIADYHSRDKGIENYTTAEDMALLLDKIYRRSLGNKNVSDQCISMLKLTRMNDRIPKYLPVDLTIAHKTGLENGVCHDAGIVFTNKGDIIIVVLTKHANSNSAPSKGFIAKVSLHAYRYLEQF